MVKYILKTKFKQLLADTITPVSIYLILRDQFPNSILLESSDYHSNENSFSYICCNPIASIVVENEMIKENFPDGRVVKTKITDKIKLPDILNAFARKFESDKTHFDFINSGLFGYISYDAVRYFEDIEISGQNTNPDIIYSVYQNIIVINHFKNELYIFDHCYEGNINNIEFIESLLKSRNFPSYRFYSLNDEQSNFSDKDFLKIIAKGKEHCHRGDVYQIVLSRKFWQTFQGDEFNVYRALRSINPSPYLFYFDYGSFKVFGSSPEAQLIIKNNKASIHPIAGTFKRTGFDKADAQLAEKLKKDPKENAEHVMLVDLARNDLSRNGKNVQVETYKEIQYYSHVIHLVSKVQADCPPLTPPRGGIGHPSSLSPGNSDGKAPPSGGLGGASSIIADTFPAGTLSGAPKYRAMQLIDEYEKGNRGLYGGCIGFMGFNGDFNHAIIIRSFVSKDNQLHYQAGAGIVAASKPENELQEVNNKLMALRKAVELAKKI
ncbi:MAG: anthranilate synthase component I family protein [Bacteroidetes bacterium]|nr:anthranilate synthase component I family protein [Bacteroidota bacterium]